MGKQKEEKMTELTPQQKLSLATDRNIAVTAGAGTGKTRILVERFIHVLLTGDVDIKEVLAITFTDKAAAEMLQRVANRIDQLLDSDSTQENKSKLFQIKNRLNSAHISTIHAFCSRLLRENPIEAGVDPDFKTLNDFQNTLMQNEVTAEILETVNLDGDNWVELLRFFGLYNIEGMLIFSLDHRYEIQKYLNNNQTSDPKIIFKKLINYYLETVSNSFDVSLLNNIHSIIQTIPVSEFETAKQNVNGAKVVESIELYLHTSQDKKLLEFWENLFLVANVFTTKDGNAYKNLAHLGSKNSWSSKSAQLLLELSDKLSVISEWIRNNPSTPPSKTDELLLLQLPKFYELFQFVQQKYSEKKSELSSLDFEDMQIFALELLQRNPDVRSKVARQFKYIMVDEFQDTNLLQWEIISKLGELKDNKFFIVGDPKQSIYGFRNADVRVFNQIKEQFELNLSVTDKPSNIILSDSFRFKENVNTFINDIFSVILSGSQHNPWDVNYDSLNSLRNNKSGGSVELALLPENDSVDVQAEFISEQINRIINNTNYNYGDIAILLRTRNHLNEIEEQLRKSEIPFKTIGGIGFYQRQEIYDVYHLIQFLVNPHNDMALVGILRSPFVNISDEALLFLAMRRNKKSYWEMLDEVKTIKEIPGQDLQRLTIFKKRSSHWIQRRDRIELSVLLEEIIHECFYQVSMLIDFNGEQLFANLKKIIRVAEEYEKTGYSSLIDFAESLKQLINSTTKEGEAQTDLEEETTVKVMTVHQAKGLEFPIVIHPYLEQQKYAYRDNCFFDEEWGLVATPNPFIMKDKSFYLLELLKYTHQQKELAELKRLFYVACSRAQDVLILTATVHKKNIPTDTPLQWLTNALKIDHQEIIEANFENLSKDELKIYTAIPSLSIIEKGKQSKAAESVKILKNTDPSFSTEMPHYLKQISDQPKNDVFSATQLMTFMKDKQSYFNRYHLGFFEEDYEKLATSEVEQDLAIIKGKIIHKYLELYPDIDLESLMFEFEVLNPEFVNELKSDLELFKLRTINSKYLAPILQAREHKNEVVINMKLEDNFLTGTIDRMYKNENDIWEVVDYKSNKIKTSQIQLTGEGYIIQMEVYALLLSCIFPEQDNYIITLYFIHPDNIFQKIFTKEDLKQIENKFLQTINEIKQFYPYTNKSLF